MHVTASISVADVMVTNRMTVFPSCPSVTRAVLVSVCTCLCVSVCVCMYVCQCVCHRETDLES